MPSIKSTIILFVIAVISVTAAFVSSRNDAFSGNGELTSFELFSAKSLPVDKVERVTIVRRGKKPMVFERSSEGWRETAPIQYRMDPFSIRKFAADASRLEVVAQLDESEQPASALGLDPPLATLTLEWEGGSQTINFGRPGVGGRGYIQLPNVSEVYIVDRALHERVIEMDEKEWRLRDLFQYASVDSLAVEYTSVRGDGFRVERDRRKWRLTEPFGTRLDTLKAEEYLGRIGSAKLSAFILDRPDDLSQFGLDQPSMTFTVRSPVRRIEEGQTVRDEIEERIVFGAPQGLQGRGYYAMHEGGDVVFSLSAEAFAEMINVVALIDLTASGVNSADVFSIRITTGKTDFTLERDPNHPAEWISPDFAGQSADAHAVSGLLDILTSIPATQIVPQPFDFDHLVAQFILIGLDGSPLLNGVVRVSDDSRAGLWLLDNGESTEAGDTIFRVLPKSAIHIPITPQEFQLR